MGVVGRGGEWVGGGEEERRGRGEGRGGICFTHLTFGRHHNTLVLSALSSRLPSGVAQLSLWAPYWVVNNTGLNVLLKEAGAEAQGFGGGEVPIVSQRVCENQRRASRFHPFSPHHLNPIEHHAAFSDEHMSRTYASLEAVSLPPGWVWLDGGWEVEGGRDADEQGWQYGVGWTTGWSATP